MPWFDVVCKVCAVPFRRFKSPNGIAVSGVPSYCNLTCAAIARAEKLRKPPHCIVCGTDATRLLVRDRTRPAGVRNLCKECSAGYVRLRMKRCPVSELGKRYTVAYNAAWRDANREHVKAYERKRYSTEEGKALKRESARRYRAKLKAKAAQS